jgi:hypothetical protein
LHESERAPEKSGALFLGSLFGMKELDASRRIRPAVWLYGWAAAAVFFTAFAFIKQSWVDSASLNDPRAAPRAVTPRVDQAAGEKSIIALFRQASPSVVNITAISVQRDLFTLNLCQIPEGTGSGFVWDRAMAISLPTFT